ncbi:MAG TPA: hypothetical protein VJZ17_02425, partial [Nitrosopumilaceae archaeon]|nr:hypothetical protein [Nitrosopumilaceae archaeon]
PAAGKIKVNDVLADTYTVLETDAPTDTAPDPDADRSVTVAAGATVSIGDPDVDDNTGNDMADFHNIQFPVVTDSSLCRFDKNDERPGDQFRNLFTPAPANIGFYRDTSTNPGQFYYNIFVSGTPGEEFEINVETAYPFVTHGANPIQGHDSYSTNSDGCFVPEGSVELNVDEEDVLSEPTPSGKKAIVVNDYASDASIQTAEDPDQTTTLPFTITGTMPDSGLVYVTMHLDYAFKHTESWSRVVGDNAAIANADNEEFAGKTKPDLGLYAFSSQINGGDILTHGIENENTFKTNPGAYGIVLNANTELPLDGKTVKFYDQAGKLLGTGTTDENGYFFIAYKHTGKAQNFKLELLDPTMVYIEQMKANKYILHIFEVP